MLLSLSLLSFLASPALALDLQAPTGLKQGHVATFLVTGGTPGATVGVVYGGPPPGVCPPVLGGLCLSVSAPVLVGTAVVGGDGTAEIQALVPQAAPLIDVRLQAAQAGANPAVSSVRTVPVLRAHVGGLTVTDAASLEVARHVWSTTLGIELAAGPYPLAVSLPIEETLWVFVTGGARDVTLPALRTVDDVYVGNTPGARVSAPAWVSGRVGTSSIETQDNTGPVTVDAPALTALSYVQLLRDAGAITISAPSVTTAVSFNIVDVGGDLSGVLPTLTTGANITITGYTAPDLTLLPALQSADSVIVGSNPGLVRIVQLGVAGMTAGQVQVYGNPLLTDLSGLAPAAITDLGYCATNPSLPSCACADLVAVAVRPACEQNLPDTCSDDPGDLCTP